MIADLVDNAIDIRLITRNVMSIFSTKDEYVYHLAYVIKHTRFLVNDEIVRSEKIVAFVDRGYNSEENIFRYVNKRFSIRKFTEYLNFFDKNHLLWLHFSDLSKYDRLLVEILIALLHDKQIIYLDYFDDAPFAHDLISLLFEIGLEDKLIIYPCRDVAFGVSNSTCQCYAKSYESAKIQSRFSEEYLAEELSNPDIEYTASRPCVYIKHGDYLIPKSYHYSLQEILLIFLFSIKLLCIKAFNWSIKCH